MAQVFYVVRLISAICVLTVLSACATQAVVSEENRDTAGTYDGIWRVSTQGREGTQFASATNVRCNKLNWNSILKIEDGKGEADLRFGAYNIPFYVGADGGFNVGVKTEKKWSDGKNIFVSLVGTLSEQSGKGVYSIGYGWAAAGGCRYKAKFVKTRL